MTRTVQILAGVVLVLALTGGGCVPCDCDGDNTRFLRVRLIEPQEGGSVAVCYEGSCGRAPIRQNGVYEFAEVDYDELGDFKSKREERPPLVLRVYDAEGTLVRENTHAADDDPGGCCGTSWTLTA